MNTTTTNTNTNANATKTVNKNYLSNNPKLTSNTSIGSLVSSKQSDRIKAERPLWEIQIIANKMVTIYNKTVNRTLKMSIKSFNKNWLVIQKADETDNNPRSIKALKEIPKEELTENVSTVTIKGCNATLKTTKYMKYEVFLKDGMIIISGKTRRSNTTIKDRKAKVSKLDGRTYFSFKDKIYFFPKGITKMDITASYSKKFDLVIDNNKVRLFIKEKEAKHEVRSLKSPKNDKKAPKTFFNFRGQEFNLKEMMDNLAKRDELLTQLTQLTQPAPLTLALPAPLENNLMVG